MHQRQGRRQNTTSSSGGGCASSLAPRATRHPLGRPGRQDLQSPFPGNTWTGRQQHDFLEPMSWLRPFVQLNLAACNAHACETGAKPSAGARAGARARSYNKDPEQQSPLLSVSGQGSEDQGRGQKRSGPDWRLASVAKPPRTSPPRLRLASPPLLVASGLFCSSAKASPANHRVPVEAESLPTERSIPDSFARCGLLVPASQDTACRSEDFFPSSLAFCRSLSALLSRLAPRGLDQRSRSFRSHFVLPFANSLARIGDHVQGAT